MLSQLTNLKGVWQVRASPQQDLSHVEGENMSTIHINHYHKAPQKPGEVLAIVCCKEGRKFNNNETN